MPIARFAAMAMILLTLASPALAQGAPAAPDSKGWIAMVISIIVIVAVLVASFMSSKRGHQD